MRPISPNYRLSIYRQSNQNASLFQKIFLNVTSVRKTLSDDDLIKIETCQKYKFFTCKYKKSTSISKNIYNIAFDGLFRTLKRAWILAGYNLQILNSDGESFVQDEFIKNAFARI